MATRVGEGVRGPFWHLSKIALLNVKQKRDRSQVTKSIRFPSLTKVQDGGTDIRGIHREYSSKLLKHSIVKRILVFKQ